MKATPTLFRLAAAWSALEVSALEVSALQAGNERNETHNNVVSKLNEQFKVSCFPCDKSASCDRRSRRSTEDLRPQTPRNLVQSPRLYRLWEFVFQARIWTTRIFTSRAGSKPDPVPDRRINWQSPLFDRCTVATSSSRCDNEGRLERRPSISQMPRITSGK
jgi:hypothetical protein